MVGVFVAGVADSVRGAKLKLCLQLRMKMFNTVHRHPFLRHPSSRSFSSTLPLTHSTGSSCTPYSPPSLNLLHQLLQTLWKQLSSMYISLAHLLLLLDQNKTRLPYFSAVSLPKAEKLRVQMDCRTRNSHTQLSHIYSPTPSCICSLLPPLCLSLHRPSRQKGLLCKCTSE